MKRYVLFILPAILLFTSCSLTVVEEPVVVHDARDHFTGVFDVEEYSETAHGHSYYTINITKSGRYPGSVYINNFYGAGISVIADVDGFDVYIPEQEIDGYYVVGDGFIEGNELVLSYSVHDHYNSNFTDYCSTVAWR